MLGAYLEQEIVLFYINLYNLYHKMEVYRGHLTVSVIKSIHKSMYC